MILTLSLCRSGSIPLKLLSTISLQWTVLNA
ncbi:hypothetical protein OESDEN_23874 [Oesophagostomum dentatum]|uniref:Uncharacterized protein n=1 Tax=Oesophagostomum dentatum TaxID=61180 RepID=A0A0B1RXZ5_OESDE|nr:hypothetical protein OESDEN_23874 [Oesophagostomum dentatum]